MRVGYGPCLRKLSRNFILNRYEYLTWFVHKNKLDSGLANLEICFDSIQYMDIGQSRFFEENELELELKEGDPEFHWKITNLLSQQYTLTPSFQSKYERGVKLLNVFG